MTQLHKRVGSYIFGPRIGRGAFAEVYKGTHQTTGDEVAIKMISRQKSKEDEAMIEKEIKILKELSHPNIVKFMDYQKTSNHVYLIFEYCKHGDFSNFIAENYKNGIVEEYQAQKFIQQIIEGIKSMKEKNIVHRDLKLANILVSKDFVLKIADFGLARHFDQENVMLKTMVGTPLNMDPFILERKSYNEKCDIWSLGVIFYQILTGKPPYDPGRKASLEDLIALIKKQPLSFPKELNLSNAFIDLITKMLTYDISKRISFEELFAHEWITGKVKIGSQISLGPDLDASQLLRSQADMTKIEKKKEKLKIAKEEGLLKEEPKIVQKVVKEVPQKELMDLNSIPEEVLNTELYGCVFLAKTYEVLRKSIYELSGRVMLVNDMTIPNSPEEDPIMIVHALLLMQILKIYSGLLNGQFSICDENKEDNMFSDDFGQLWNKIWANREFIENFYNTDTSSMDVADLMSDVKANFKSTYEAAISKINSVQDVFDKFQGHRLDALMMESLVHISEQVAYNEYLAEDVESIIEKYKICLRLCDFYKFKKNFQLNKFKIVKSREDSKDLDFDEFSKAVAENFKTQFNFKYISTMSLRPDFRTKFQAAKLSLGVTNIIDSNPTEQDLAVERLSELIERRINDLTNN